MIETGKWLVAVCRVPKVSCFCADLEAKVATFKFKSEYKLYVAI